MNGNNESDSDDSLFGSSSSAQPDKKRQKLNGVTKTSSVNANHESDGDDSLFGSSSSSSSSSSRPNKKRRKMDDSTNDDGNQAPDGQESKSATSNTKQASGNAVDPVLLKHAKSRLSKFAARLFDPNRIKGLVEAPMVIPLNDEFLKAFGKREKEFDRQRGRQEEIDQKIADDDEEEGENGIGKKDTTIINRKDAQKKKEEIHKVKINNLSYRTTEDTLFKNCLQFGDLVEVKMVLDGPAAENKNNHNSGRAYVTFNTEEGAQSCIEGLKSLNGRQLRCTVAFARPPKNSTGSGPRTSASLLNNQSTKDISTICFRCGQVGHMVSDCPNPAKPKPCCLCGMTDHDFRFCPNKQICFNCGQPGHVSRECTMRRGMPRRMVCGTCFQSGHHRLQCHRAPPRNVWEAVCMDSGKKGQFMSKELKWFYGLKGMSCFNCGSQEHSGYDCNRPTLYHCITNPEMALQEIEMAEANSVAEELERERRQQREKGNHRSGGRNQNRGNGGGQKRRRAKSSGPGRRDRRGY